MTKRKLQANILAVMKKLEPTKKSLIVIAILISILVGTGVFLAFNRHLVVLGKRSNSLPKEWSYKFSSNCNLDLPIPPNKPPYQQKAANSTRYWQKEEFSSQQNDLTNTIARVIYKYPNEQGGLISGVVIVYCSPNKTQDNTDSYVKKFEQRLGTDPSFKGLSLQSKAQKNYWGRPVIQIIAKAQNGDLGEYFFFATKEHIYLVRPQSQVKDTMIRDTTKQIFLGLQFYDQL